MSLRPTSRYLTLTALTCLATTVACGGGGAPELNGLEDQVAQVGTELILNLNGTDPDGDKLDYNFKAADLTDLGDRASVSVSPSGAGVFRWTPTAMDLGEHAFDFTVSDGDNSTTVTINIDVRSAIGAATAPVFRAPLGTGTTIDLTAKKCIDLNIVIEDQDTAEVTITQEEPLIEGAELNQEGGLNATWHWCPTKDQESESRYTLVLAADDGENPKTIKNYLVVLRSGGGGTSCPGAAPQISHTPADETTVVDLTIPATVTDDQGLKEAPLFYYSLTNPGSNPDLGTMTQLSTLRITGTSTNGEYAADVPNPVAGMAAGTSRELYYVFVADDDDDEMGNCDHSTVSQVYSMTVTSNGQADLPICASCTSDTQCGSGDLCVYVGSAGASYCMQGCGSGCPSGYTCSASEVYSVDYETGYQCIPQSGSCAAPSGTCEDDTYEENDTRTAAAANPALTAGANEIYDFVSCPKAMQTSGANTDDDWYRIVLPASSRTDIEMAGGPATDLDLHLYKSDGTVITKSTSLNPDEQIIKCLAAGTYYVKVNGYGVARNEYIFRYQTTAESCSTTCTDDSREDDDTYSQARTTTFPTYSSLGNVTCPNDDDWYKVRLFTGDVLNIDLTFTQSNSQQDLDLHLYNQNLTDLWPCSYDDYLECSPDRGQGAVSNEHATYTVPAGCTNGCDYYVVVRGWNGSTNSYSIDTSIQ